MSRSLAATRAAYLLALAAGAAFSIWLLSWHRILPADSLHMALVGDPAISAIGERYFLAQPWGWPLLHAAGPDAPHGINIALTDSIPLAALVLKLFRTAVPPGFFAGPAWVALLWTLQPVAAVFALRSAGERRLGPALAVIVLSLSLPTLLIRYGHMALCSHAAILAALGLYFRLVAPAGRARLWLAAGGLALLCLLVHPYIMAMAAGVLAAAPATLLLRRDRRWLQAAGCYGAMLAVLGLAAVLLGYGGTMAAPGFGYYSMNLLGPFLPSRSGLFPDLLTVGTDGQSMEGYQYLGAGLLLLLAVAVVQVVRGRAGVAWRDHAGLLLVLVGTAVFSLSNDVYFGPHRLVHIGRVPGWLQQFRATGRFFWPVAYTLLIAGVLVAARSLPRGAAAALLALAVVLQVADTAPLRNGLRAAAHGGDAWVLDTAALGPVFAAHRRLTLWPSFGCGAAAEDAPIMQALLLASETQMPTNTMPSARNLAAIVCDPAAVLGAPLAPGELRVLTRAQDRWLVPDAAQACRTAGLLVLCARDAAAWTALPPLPEKVLPLGAALGPTDPRLVDALAQDWSAPSVDGIWSDGTTPTLRLALPPGTGAGTMLTMQAIGFAATPGGTQAVDVVANGQPVAHWTLPDLGAATVQATLPAGPVLLALHVASPGRPIDRHENADTRRLGILLRSLRLDPAPP